MTTPLISSLADATGLPRLDTGRLRATWLADCAQLRGLPAFLAAAGISCSQAPWRHHRHAEPRGRSPGGGTARRDAVISQAALRRLEETVDRSKAATRIEALLPTDVRPRQLLVRTPALPLELTAPRHAEMVL